MSRPQRFLPKAEPIEAMQIGVRNFEQVVAWIKESHDGFLQVDPEQMTIVFKTPHGFVTASYGWWVAKNSRGVFYPIKKDNFRHKYKEIHA